MRACELDVAVRKPGNVSRASAGHRMRADQFMTSAQAAAGPLFEPGTRVGERIERAVEASWAAAACNTNLGIVLLCAPIALALERQPDAVAPAALTLASAPDALTPSALRDSIESVLADLDVADARAAFRAIARANPGGLGAAPIQDVRRPPSMDLRAAMALAAPRDRIARQYRDGCADVFEIGLVALDRGFSLGSSDSAGEEEAATAASVQRLYLALLSRFADSHIVRNHGEAVAHTVMTAAQAWRERARRGESLDRDPGFAAWDQALKAERINPGTTADLCVATLLVAGSTRRS